MGECEKGVVNWDVSEFRRDWAEEVWLSRRARELVGELVELGVQAHREILQEETSDANRHIKADLGKFYMSKVRSPDMFQALPNVVMAARKNDREDRIADHMLSENAAQPPMTVEEMQMYLDSARRAEEGIEEYKALVSGGSPSVDFKG